VGSKDRRRSASQQVAFIIDRCPFVSYILHDQRVGIADCPVVSGFKWQKAAMLRRLQLAAPLGYLSFAGHNYLERELEMDVVGRGRRQKPRRILLNGYGIKEGAPRLGELRLV
jgi:hypothetical protein